MRYYLGAAHYRSTIEYSPDGAGRGRAAYRRIENFVDARRVDGGGTEPTARVPDAFAGAMDDDLGVPAALAVLHETVRGRQHRARRRCEGRRCARRSARCWPMTSVLGINPRRRGPYRRRRPTSPTSIDALVRVALDQRTAARARKDFAAADAIRDQLAAAGVVVEDTPDGPRWSLA